MAFIKITNAVGTTEEDVNQIERYFREKYQIPTPSSWECITCGKKMIRQNRYTDSHPIFTENDIMIGGHLRDRYGNLYLTPICKECNDKKEKLGFVEVDIEVLLPI